MIQIYKRMGAVYFQANMQIYGGIPPGVCGVMRDLVAACRLHAILIVAEDS